MIRVIRGFFNRLPRERLPSVTARDLNSLPTQDLALVLVGDPVEHLFDAAPFVMLAETRQPTTKQGLIRMALQVCA